MRIVRADVTAVAAPFPTPLRFAEVPLTTNTAVVTHLHDASGATGFGYAPTFGFGTSAMLAAVRDDFADRLISAELDDASVGVRQMLRHAWIAGRPAGLVRQAIAVLEMALNDLEAKLVGRPLHHLWGQRTEAVQAYASGGWRYLAIDELTRFARGSVDRGFSAIKIQVGLSPSEDVLRLQAVREAVGPDVHVMVDANQRMPTAVAAEWVAELAPLRPYWLEEPICAECHEDLAALRAATDVAIAAGESETEPSELADLLRRDAVDVIQPDVHRAGMSAARDISVDARIRGATVAPHMAHEIGAHLLSGAPAPGWLEYFDWFEDWWESPVAPQSGRIEPSMLPGHGLQLRPGWIEAHAIR